MKQTNNAIKFLLAQYRAIFKNAYFKGLASAVVLTAGLAAGANANAEGLSSTDNFGAAQANGGTIYITSEEDAVEGKSNFSSITVSVDDNASKNTIKGTVNISSGEATVNTITAGSGSAAINSTSTTAGQRVGTINITNGAGLGLNGGTTDGHDLTVNLSALSLNGENSTLALTAASSGSVTLNVDSITADAATVINLNGNADQAENATIDAGKWNLTDAVINLASTTAKGSATVKGQLSDGSSTTVNVTGTNDSIEFYTSGEETATMNLTVSGNKSGTITFSSDEGKTQLNLVNSKFNIAESGVLNIKSGSVALKNSEPLVGEGSSVNVRGTLNITADTNAAASLSAPVFNLADGSTVVLTGDTSDKTAAISGELSDTSTGSIESKAGLTTIGLYTTSDNETNVDLTVTAGTATINLAETGKDTLKLGSDATVTVTGVLAINQGTLDLTNAVLAAGAQYQDGSSGEISIGSGASLVVDYNELTTFLGDETKSGSVILVSGSTLELTDAENPENNVDLGSYTFAEAGASGSIAATEAGAIIKGDNLSITGDAGQANFTVNATNFTVGASGAYTPIVSSFASINVADKLEFLSNAYLDVKGNFVLNATDGSGSITTQNKVTLSSGDITVNKGQWDASADLELGNSTASAGNITVDGSTNAASLVLGADKTITLISGSISASGSQASLDLSSGSLGTSAAVAGASLSATDGATVTINSADLAGLGANVQVKADGSTINAKGESLELTDSKFVADGTAGIALINDAKFTVDGALTVSDEAADGTIDLSAITGTVSANGLTFNADETKIDDGLTVTGKDGLQLTAINALNSNAALTFANLALTLGETSNTQGTLGQSFTVGTGASVNVLGAWVAEDANAPVDVTVSGGALNVGNETTAGSLTADNFTVSAGSTTVAKNSSLTANTITTATGTTVTVNGNVTINGIETAEITAGDDGYKGFNQKGTVTVDGGKFTIGATASSGLLGTWKDTPTEQDPQNYVNDNFGQYALTNNGTLSLGLNDSISLDGKQLTQIKEELISNYGKDDFKGILDIGDAKLSDLEGVINNGTIDWNDFQSVNADSNLDSTINKQLAEATVQNVSGNFNGNIGAVELAQGENSLNVTDDSILLNAGLNESGNFISNANGDLVGATVASGNLTLKGNGSVGDIAFTGENASLTLDTAYGADDKAVTINVAGVDATTNDVANNNILAGTAVKVNKNVTANFQGAVIVDTLNVSGSAQFDKTATDKTATVNTLNTADGTSFTADNLTVNSAADVKGSLTIAKDLIINSSASKDGDNNPVKGTVAGEVNVGNDLTTTNVALNNKVTVSGDFYANDTEINGTATTVTGDLIANAIEVAQNATISAANATLTGNTTIDGTLTIADSGSVTVGSGSTSFKGAVTTDSLNLDGSQGQATLTILGTSVSVDTVTGSDYSIIAVGSDAAPVNEGETNAGSMHIGTLNQNGAALVVDPSYDDRASIVTVESLSGSTAGIDVGVFTGNVFVGQNSALGVGEGLTESILKDKLADYMNGDRFADPADGGYGAILYLDRPASIDSKYGIVLTSGSNTELQAHVSGSTGAMSSYDPSTYAVANTIYFGQGTALAVNIDNYKAGDTYLEFVGSDGKTPATGSTLVADGGEIVLFGDNYKREYQLFNSDVSIEDLDGESGASIIVNSANGLLTGKLTNESNGSVGLTIDEKHMGEFMYGTSTPVQQTIAAYLNGYNGEYENESDIPVDAYLGTLNKDNKYDYNNYFLSQVVLGGSGADVEKVARLGVYGGVAQAALTAGASTYEAVNGRMGIGAQTGSITFADNGQGAGLWVSPIYKNHDSDDFGAQGVNYGADLDLYGVALGGDYTLANGLRVGAAFNVGSGDADGQGAGAGVSNDFDYYGFTVYGGYTAGALSVVGNISYTVVDNDVEANTSVEKVTASMDSSNLSIGITGQYALNLGSVTVTPHAGLRYTNIDMDDYTVKGSKDIAKYDADSANIFSIPVGVTLSKDITAGDWTVKPAFDVTLTANMGDDSVDGSVSWAGVDNLKTNLESEIIDSFTYGATLGVSAKNDNFSFGIGVNYTGASSANEYGVSANARFVF